MKVLCPRCDRLVELRDYKLESGALVVTCPACNQTTRVSPSSPEPGAPPATVPLTPVAPAPSVTGERPALQLTSAPGTSNVVALRLAGSDAVSMAGAAARSGPFEVPAGRCPKCIATRQPSASSCSQCGLTFAQFDAREVAPGGWLQTGWVDLLSDWGNEELHVSLRHRAVSEQDLASVGRLYRLRLAACPEDPFAARGRDEVLRMALVPSTLAKRSLATEKIDPKWKYVLVVGALLACLGLLAVMARAMLSPE